jgi:enoyl-CoA hydratase/carnithine racemase
MEFETLDVRQEGAVLLVDIAAPPMNLLGPGLVRDLVALIQRAETADAFQVLVFRSADPDYRQEAAKLTGEASIGLLFRHLSASRLVTIPQIAGRVRGAGSEFVLACDMRFAARESAIFGQPEQVFGVIPGAGGVQHLARLMGRARALEVMLSADDYRPTDTSRLHASNGRAPAGAESGVPFPGRSGPAACTRTGWGPRPLDVSSWSGSAALLTTWAHAGWSTSPP